MDSVAIIGAQCRFPGNAPDPDRFFDQLLDKRNFVQEVPRNRWNPDKFSNEAGEIGKAYTRRGHYIEYNHELFDALSFRMAPKEVEFIDPQQRLLLETTWHAFENAGVDIAALSGRSVGVYVGGFTVDHLINQFSGMNRWSIDTHSAAGATLTMLANRISYAFNLTGPSFSIDTACSSSMVAFVQAVQDLRAGRCEMAVVGGVNFMLRPEYDIAMCKGRFLAKDGRSKSFDASADGYGRGEGCGIVILQRQSDALAEGRDIIALVDGAGVNQDGRTSGITVPNPAAQEALMRQVLRDSGVDPATILYVEAHGTGTPVGDPLEASAIAAVYGACERDDPCVIGSVKSNIGHLEAGAGVAGLIKAAWVLRRNMIPPLATFETPNPALPLHDRSIALATETRPLAPPGRTARVAVNSFGYGGTNAHVILRRPDPAPEPATSGLPDILLAPVSARAAASVPAAAEALADTLGGSDPADTLFTATRRRAHFEHRAIAWGPTPAALADGLRRIAAGEDAPGTLRGEALVAPEGGTVFVYTGMGPQWWGMGRGLYRSNATYRAAVEEADAVFQRIAGFSILEEMLRDEAASRIGRTEYAQPANFLLQLGLTRALAAAGLRADAVVGHSVGEVTSSWASGMLSLEDALTVSRHRSRVQAKAAGQGGMLATALGEADAQAIAEASGGRIDIAAINAPNSITLAGEPTALQGLAADLEAQGIFARMLTVEVPYHSAYMDPLTPELIDALDDIRPQAPTIPLYSTVTGRRVETRRYDADYWAENVREPVRFLAAIRRLLDDGYTHFIEVGPQPVLSRAILDTFKETNARARHVPTLAMKEKDEVSFPRALAAAYVAGAPIDWAARHPQGRAVRLGNYPFAREKLWRESDLQRQDRTGLGTRALAQARILGGPVVADLTLRSLNFLRDHVIAGAPLMPGAGFIDAMLAAAETALPAEGGWVLADIAIDAPLVFDRDTPQALDSTVDGSSGRVELFSRNPVAPDAAVRHATATLRALQGAAPRRIAPATLRATAPVPEPVGTAYERFRGMQLDYRDAFRTIAELSRDDARRVAVARLALAPAQREDLARFVTHPALLDGSFQAALALLAPGEGAYLPVGIREFRVLRDFPADLWVEVRLVDKTPERLSCDLLYLDEQGEEVASLTGFLCAALKPPRTQVVPESDYADIYEPAAPIDPQPPAPILIVADHDDAQADQCAAQVEAAGMLRRIVRWDDPKLREALHTGAAWSPGRPCVALFFHAGLGGQDPTGEVALRKLKGVLAGFAMLREAMPRIAIVTRGALPAVPGDVPVPGQAALVGFARVAYAEITDLLIDIVDIPAAGPVPADLAQVLSVPSAERELALRPTGRFAPVLRPTGLYAQDPRIALRPDAARAARLGEAGLVEWRMDAAAPGMLRIAVEALALPAGHLDPATRFYGFVGRIAAGPDAAAIGRRVAGLAPEAEAPPATLIDLPAAAALLVDWAPPLDAALGAGAALTGGPLAALLPRLDAAPGQRALVASVPVGRALAARLQADGVAVTLVDADPEAWREAALGAGGAFDIVAAPLAEWSRRFGFGRWLAAGGTLVELAADPAPFLLPSEAGLVLRSAAPGATLPTAAAFAAQMADAARHGMRVAEPMPLAGWTGDRAAPRLVTVDPAATVTAQPDLRPRLRRDGTYLVTGGFGALGAQTALWLAGLGAGRIVVAGRRGGDTPGAAELLAALTARGSEAVALALDTADPSAVHAAIAAIDTPASPLRGVFHTAGVLADGPLLDMPDEAILQVMRPKASGALALDRATRGRPLDYFVLFSSIAVTVGNRRQANYCAANAVLDALAHARRAEGLPGLSLNLGAISEVGMAADPLVEAHLRQIGLPAMPPAAIFEGMARALHAGVAQVTAAATVDWALCVQHDPRTSRTPRMFAVAGPHLARLDGGRAAAIRAELAKASPEERQSALVALLGELVAGALRLDVEALTPTRPLDEVGIDSLIAVDVQLAIDNAIGINVSTMQIIGKATLTTVALAVLSQMGLSGSGDGPAGPAEAPTTRLAAE